MTALSLIPRPAMPRLRSALRAAAVGLAPLTALTPASAQQPYLLADLNPSPSTSIAASTPSAGIVFGDHLYFKATDAVHGGTVWRTDGTPAGTTRVLSFGPTDQGIDFAPGLPGALLACPNRSPAALYHCPLGQPPLLLKSGIRPTIGDNARTPLFAATPTKIFFVVQERDIDFTLWVSNGTVAGTQLVKDFSPGANLDPQLRSFVTIGEQLFFFANSPATGYELWTSDGTEAGTICLDINPGTPSAILTGTTMFTRGDIAYFQASRIGGGSGVWRSDGTPAGTFSLLSNQSGLVQLVDAGPVFYFVDSQLRLYRSDGTAAGTTFTGQTGISQSSGPIFGDQGSCYFISGGTLRKTVGQTSTVENLAGGASSILGLLPPLTLGAPPRVLYNIGSQLHVTSSGSSPQVVSTSALPSPFAPALGTVNSRIVFSGSGGNLGSEPWVTDATAAGTFILRDINPAASNSDPQRYQSALGVTYFDATRPGEGIERSVSTGEPGQALPCEPTVPGTGTFARTESITLPDGRTFTMQFETTGLESDGTIRIAESPARVGHILKSTPGRRLAGGRFGHLAALNDSTVLFEAESPELPEADLFGSTLWRTDGTLAGTVPVRTISDTGPVHPGEMIVIDGIAYFVALTQNNPTAPLAVWRSDGTRDGTFPLAQVGVANVNAQDVPRNFAIDGSRIYFHATTTALKLFRFDRLSLATAEIAGAGDPRPTPAAPSRILNGTMLCGLYAGPSTGNLELHRFSGTGPAEVLRDINPGVASSSPQSPTIANGPGGTPHLFFSADDGTHGRELWITDGTELGTRLVKDIWPGAAPSNPQFFTVCRGTLHFVAGDGVTGFEIWSSDGTEAGTIRLTDFGPGLDSPGIRRMFFDDASGILHFDAAIGTLGREPWAMRIGPGVCRADFNRDGFPDAMDLADYINCYFSDQCGLSGLGALLADFNGDGTADADDLGDFVNEYFEATTSGCG